MKKIIDHGRIDHGRKDSAHRQMKRIPINVTALRFAQLAQMGAHEKEKSSKRKNAISKEVRLVENNESMP